MLIGRHANKKSSPTRDFCRTRSRENRNSTSFSCPFQHWRSPDLFPLFSWIIHQPTLTRSFQQLYLFFQCGFCLGCLVSLNLNIFRLLLDFLFIGQVLYLFFYGQLSFGPALILQKFCRLYYVHRPGDSSVFTFTSIFKDFCFIDFSICCFLQPQFHRFLVYFYASLYFITPSIRRHSSAQIFPSA